MSNKEAFARVKINKLLEQSGWRFEDVGNKKRNIDLEPKYNLKRQNERNSHKLVDYVLLDDRNYPIALLEAKKESIHPLNGKEQARTYASCIGEHCRFIILSNGNTYYLWDLKIGNPELIHQLPSLEELGQHNKFEPNTKRIIEQFVSSDYIAITQDYSYKNNPNNLKFRFLRDYQIQAINSIQKAIQDGKKRFLFEMATGTGKTLTSAAIIKLFLTTQNANRVIFLVDRLELETQANKNFIEYLANDFKCLIYKENKDAWKSAEILVSTVQSLIYEDKYKKFSPSDFDLVIVDEAHRIGAEARKVFDYFIGYKLGLTATPKSYLKNLDVNKLRQNDPRQLEVRALLDTYKTFDCYDEDKNQAKPTFQYNLIDGVKDGFLINPKVVDARTDVTTRLLSEEGLVIEANDKDNNENIQDSVTQRDFEKRFFNENTNKVFCDTFMRKALKDPITHEIGKTIIFCVSQNHALKITQILNEIATQIYPNKYQSDFAVQVTSNVPNAQEYSRQFANNNLNGKANFNEEYKTSKTRVCVTVGMMTTGYDCPDILNLCLMRPIFSTTEFIQIKGRGTRKHDFKHEFTGKLANIETQKTEFKLFDFFASCEYFEEEFNYDEVIKLPSISSHSFDYESYNYSKNIDEYISTQDDVLKEFTETQIDENGMKVDRMYFQKFEDDIKNNEEIKQILLTNYLNQDQQINGVKQYIEENILDKPNKYYTLDKLRQDLKADRRISLKEIVKKILGFIPSFKSKKQLIDDEFSKFAQRYNMSEENCINAREIFEYYLTDNEFRNIIESKQFGKLESIPNGDKFRTLPKEIKQNMPDYIKDNISLNEFI